MTVEIDVLDDRHGLRVRDTAEGERLPLRTDRAVDPDPASTDGFAMPVDAAVAVDARELHSPVFTDAVFWRDGEVVHRADSAETAERLPRDTYEVALSPPGAHLYVRVEDAAPTARFADDHTYLDAGRATRLVVGVRSYHETPAGTVTTTEDPRDVMAAVSTFGSALKTHSPDRSWPTLRGHPPAIEFGDALDVPGDVTPPETEVTVEVPPEYGAIFTAAPLAYYLGATLEPGRQPRLTAAGRTHDLDAADLAGGVREVLEHAFTLDCVVRTAGIYPFRTPAADAVDERAGLDYGELFGRSLAERTAAYLEVPRAATAGLLDWHYAADVAPEPRYAAALPYLLDELALIRSPPNVARAADDGSAGTAVGGPATPGSAVVPGDAGTLGQSWVGDGYAVRAANPTVGSFRRGFEWPDGDGPLDVHVVRNEGARGTGESLYDDHPFAETAVRESHSLTTSELRAALSEDTDFLHFVGRVTEAGIECRDGVLDARTLAGTGVSAFFLNGCRSYEQGRALLTTGGVGGIVTVGRNGPHIRGDCADESVGRSVAMLLDAGYPLYAVLDVLGLTDVRTDRYAILGDGTFSVRRSVTGAPILNDFDTNEFGPDTDPIPLSVRHYPCGENGVGALASYSQMDAPASVQDGSVRDATLPRSELDAFLDFRGVPTLVDGDLVLTDDLSAEDFR